MTLLKVALWTVTSLNTAVKLMCGLNMLHKDNKDGSYG